MAIPSYPAGLPLAIRDGYSFTPVNRITRTDMTTGRARQRVEFTNVPTMLKLGWIVNAVEATVLEAWADQVCGAGWFTMTVLSPIGFEELEMRFTESIGGPDLLGKFTWQYTATVEVRFKPQLPPGYIDFPDYIFEANIFDIAMNQLWPLNPWQKYADAADKAINEDWPTP